MDAVFIVKRLLACPFTLFGGIAGISFFALAAALFSEAFLGLEPCVLCIYQRVPFLIGFVVGIVGMILRKRPHVVKSLLALLGVNFLINSGIAFYHTGVEQKWWASFMEACTVPAFLNDEQSILENLLSAPAGSCSEIPWQDPIIGLSMANYNVLLCLGIAVVCGLSLIWLMRQKPEKA